jgi:hypothetical protein
VVLEVRVKVRCVWCEREVRGRIWSGYLVGEGAIVRSDGQAMWLGEGGVC